jgi:hypothetical protein
MVVLECHAIGMPKEYCLETAEPVLGSLLRRRPGLHGSDASTKEEAIGV